MKTKELGWKENRGIQNIGTEDSKGNLTTDKRQVLKMLENYITGLHDKPDQPENLEVKPE
jgi:hypothetical protein